MGSAKLLSKLRSFEEEGNEDTNLKGLWILVGEKYE
jgi:hypothetical protein